MTVRLGFSFWGVLAKPDQSTNTATTAFTAIGERHLVVDEFLRRGHSVVCLQQRREPEPYPGVEYESEEIPEVDIAYFEWRWQQHHQLSAARRNEPDWDRQVALLDEYTKRGTPIVVMDTDLQLTAEDEARWPTMVIGEPCLNPFKAGDMHSVSLGGSFYGKRKDRIQLFWTTDFVPYHDTPDVAYNYIYLGNNYERGDQFKKYFGDPANSLRQHGIQTIAHGNWIEKSPSREDPTKIISQFPFVAFGGRLSFHDGTLAMSKSICTTLLAKQEYYSRGFVTIRIFEGLLSGIPALIPSEHHYIKSMGLDRYVVGIPGEVIARVTELSTLRKEWRQQIVREQLAAFKKLADFSPSRKVDTILSYAKTK